MKTDYSRGAKSQSEIKFNFKASKHGIDLHFPFSIKLLLERFRKFAFVLYKKTDE